MLLHVAIAEGAAAVDTVDVSVAATDGRLLARLTGLRYGVLDGDPGATASPRRLVSELAWRPSNWPRRPAGERADVTCRRHRRRPQERGLRVGEALAAAGLPWTAFDTPDDLAGRAADLRHRRARGARRPAAADSVGAAAVDAAWRRHPHRPAARRRHGPTHAPACGAVTRGVREALPPSRLSDAPLWGLGRVIGGEHPELWGGTVDLADETDPDALRRPRGRACAPGPARTSSRCAAPRCEAARLVAIEREPVRAALECRPDGTYLITGGLGVLGLEVATWLAGRGARRLVLAGRRGLPPRTAWDEMTDTSDPPPDRGGPRPGRRSASASASCSARHHRRGSRRRRPRPRGALDLPPIRGIVHAAGVLDNRMAVNVDEESLAHVMGPKVAGAMVLHELFAPGQPWTSSRCSPRAASSSACPARPATPRGNAFLDALAAHRAAARRHRTVSYAWTSWRGLGMSTSSELIDAELAARGAADISAAEAFRSWEFASRYDAPYYAVLRTVELDPPRVRPAPARRTRRRDRRVRHRPGRGRLGRAGRPRSCAPTWSTRYAAWWRPR